MRNLLVVDDSVEFASLIEAVGRLIPCQVIAASDGPAGLDVLHRLQPDLMLLDVYMPAMNGLDVLCTLRAQPLLLRPRKIILTSAQPDAELRRDAVELGADAFMGKDELNFDTLTELLNTEKHRRTA